LTHGAQKQLPSRGVADASSHRLSVFHKTDRNAPFRNSSNELPCPHTPRHRERLEGNTVYRGTRSNANQRTSIHRFLDQTTGNEEYVLVPDGNIVSLAT